MIKFNAEIEIINGKINITPNDYYLFFEDFIWDNKEKTLNEIINVLPF